MKYPNVAGSFYPQDENELSKMIDLFLTQVRPISLNPKGIIAPHAGFVYSGPIAAVAYSLLKNMKQKPQKIAVFSPSHYYRFSKIATSNQDFFNTPLGNIKLDQSLLSKVIQQNFASLNEEVFEQEHALEVHLPFLQKVVGSFELLPFIVGPTDPDELKELISFLVKEDVFIVISTDLSHFHSYDEANLIDQKTCELIINKDEEKILGDHACGVYPLKGVLKWAKENRLEIKLLDRRNSGDTSKNVDRVVGYASFAIF